MMGRQTGDQSQLFYLFNLERRIPAGHLLRRINPVVTRVEPSFAELFISHLLARNIRVEEDLVDQLFNSSEKRLARPLLP